MPTQPTERQDGSVVPKGARPLLLDRNLHVVFSISFLVVMGVSSLTPVFPAVVEAFGISPEQVGLLITLYAVPGIFLTPVYGVLADRFGRKQVLVPALVLFALAGSGCSLVRDFQLLLVLRFLQGVGGASLGFLTATLVGDLYQGTRRTEAMGYKASVLSVSSAVLPTIGGALALIGWYVPFALPIIGLGVGAAVLFLLEVGPTKADASFMTYLGDAWAGMRTPRVIGLYAATFLSFVVLYGAYMTFIPLHLAERFGSSPPAIGLVMTLGSLTTALVASRLGVLSRFVSPDRLLPMAFVLFALSFFLIPVAPGYWWAALAVGVFGIGQAWNYAVVLTLLAGEAPDEHRAIFMGVNGMVIRAGQALGPVIMAGVFAAGGMASVFYSASGLCLVVFLILPFLLRRRGPTGSFQTQP
jgi:predicted MFS family arabinose efflux permease